MAPNIKDQLPILNKILQFFKRDGLMIDSPLFRLHHQVFYFQTFSLYRNIFVSTNIIEPQKNIFAQTLLIFAIYCPKSYFSKDCLYKNLIVPKNSWHMIFHPIV